VLQAFFETLHRNLPQKIHIQPCDGIARWNGLTGLRECGLLLMKVEPAERGSTMRRFEMRKVILAVLAASGLAALGAAPAEAVGTRYPFCLQGDEYPALSYCTFTSYEQCQATASGRFLTCIANPYYIGESEPPPAGYRPLRGRALPPAPGPGRY